MKKLTLVHDDFLKTGIFGHLEDDDKSFRLFTLEHAYELENGQNVWAPKVPPGVYMCQRGQHRLAKMVAPFETFEITGVEGHTNILFHCGNTENDSEGCVLLGTLRDADLRVLNSRVAFKAFMDALTGVDQFELTVI